MQKTPFFGRKVFFSFLTNKADLFFIGKQLKKGLRFIERSCSSDQRKDKRSSINWSKAKD